MTPKSRNYLSRLTMAFLGLLVSGCGGAGAKDPVQAAKNEANAPQLTDHWESNCIKSKVLDASLRINYDFGGDIFKETQVYFSEEDCRLDAVAATLEYSGTFKVYTNSSPNQLDFDYTQALLTAKNERGRSLLDDLDFCGVEVWTINEVQNITTRERSLKCPIKGTPHARLDIFRVIGDNRLEMGSGYIEKAADQPAERPSEFAADAPFFKK